MRRHAHADERSTGGDRIGHRGVAGKQQGERARPESGHQLARRRWDLRRPGVEHGVDGDGTGDVDDDRIPRGALLGGEDARDGCGVEGVGAQAVDGLRWQGNQSSVAQNLGSACDAPGARRRNRDARDPRPGEVSSPFYCRRRRTQPSSAVYSLVTMAIETEIKFRVEDLAGWRRGSNPPAFELETPRSLRATCLYDTPDRTDARAHGDSADPPLLREMARDAQAPAGRGAWRRPAQARIETETEVADGAAIAAIFQSLGLVAAFRYEKWRSEWSDGAGALRGG